MNIILSDHSLTAANGAPSVIVNEIRGRIITWQYDISNDSGGNLALLPEPDPENPTEPTESDIIAAIAASDKSIIQS